MQRATISLHRQSIRAATDEFGRIRAALAATPETEPDALQAMAYESPQFALRLFAFLSHLRLGACPAARATLSAERTARSDPAEEIGATYATLAVLLATFGEQSPITGVLGAIGDALRR